MNLDYIKNNLISYRQAILEYELANDRANSLRSELSGSSGYKPYQAALHDLIKKHHTMLKEEAALLSLIKES